MSWQPEPCEDGCECIWGDDADRSECACDGPCSGAPEWLDRPRRPTFTFEPGRYVVLLHNDGTTTILEPYDDGSGHAEIMVDSPAEAEAIAEALIAAVDRYRREA